MQDVRICFIAILCAFALSVLSGLVVISFLRRLKAGQPILEYVKEHKSKSGTPTMGGLFFIPAAAIIFFVCGGGAGRVATVSVTIGLAFMLVGFLDDFLKIRHKRNEGLKAYQKILFQTAIALVAGFFAYRNGITSFFVPFFKTKIDMGWVTVPFIAFIFIAITNGVNLTDGLDGLAGGTSVAYLAFIALLIVAEKTAFTYMFLKNEEYESLVLLACCLIGATVGFLCFNVSPAKVFMGDTGSLSLGGFIGAISVFSFNSFFIPIIGAVFVVSVITVMIQVAHFKRTKKRVFLMAPFHHHLQLKGNSETQISFLYLVATCITGALSVIFYL